MESTRTGSHEFVVAFTEDGGFSGRPRGSVRGFQWACRQNEEEARFESEKKDGQSSYLAQVSLAAVGTESVYKGETIETMEADVISISATHPQIVLRSRIERGRMKGWMRKSQRRTNSIFIPH